MAASTAGTSAEASAGTTAIKSTPRVTRSSMCATCPAKSPSSVMPSTITSTPSRSASASAAVFAISQNGLANDFSTNPIVYGSSSCAITPNDDTAIISAIKANNNFFIVRSLVLLTNIAALQNRLISSRNVSWRLLVVLPIHYMPSWRLTAKRHALPPAHFLS